MGEAIIIGLLVTTVLLAAVSTGLTVEGQKAQAKSVADAASARAKAATEAGISQERELRRRNRLDLAAQRLRLAGSGIQVTGSPLEVLASNAAEFEREAIELRNEFGRVTALEISQARSARLIGTLGAAASAVAGAGQITATLAGAGAAKLQRRDAAAAAARADG